MGEVLWPESADSKTENSNDDSLVLHISHGDVRFLLTGDLEQKIESQLVANHSPLASDFIKVGHHGSKTSSSEAFLEAVGPRVAVASVGDGNQFGHPAPVVVERYAKVGPHFLRTDRDGAVTVLTDGRTLRVHTFAGSDFVSPVSNGRETRAESRPE